MQVFERKNCCTSTSTAINVEAHDNAGDAAAPIVGDPISGNVKWGLASYAVDASTTDMSGANLKFVADGQPLDAGYWFHTEGRVCTGRQCFE